MYRPFFFLLLVFYLQEVKAVVDLQLFFIIKPANLSSLVDEVYGTNSDFSYCIKNVDDQGYRKAVILFMGHSENVISCLVAPSRELGVFAGGSDDYEFPMHIFNFTGDEIYFIRYIIIRSLWRHLFYMSFQEEKDSESTFAKSLINTDSDLEVVLFFKCSDNEKIKEGCKKYFLEALNKFGWSIEFIDRRKEGFIYIRVIIALGDESDNNYQSFQLDPKVHLDIKKSGIRIKGAKDRSTMIFLPLTLCQKIACESLAVSDVQNQKDYCAFGMIGINSTCVWTFPRIHSQLLPFVKDSKDSAIPNTPAINVHERCRMFADMAKKIVDGSKAFCVALTGITITFKSATSNDANTLSYVGDYLHELGFEVRQMPSDGYCGWHAILYWLRSNRYERLLEIDENPDNLTAPKVFDYFAAQVQEKAEAGDERGFIKSIADEMNGDNPDKMWLDDNQLAFLIAPFINENILVFDIASSVPTLGCPFRISLIKPDGIDVEFHNQSEVADAIDKNRDCMMLLHASNHWMLIMPGHKSAITEAPYGGTTPGNVAEQGVRIDWRSVVIPQHLL